MNEIGDKDKGWVDVSSWYERFAMGDVWQLWIDYSDEEDVLYGRSIEGNAVDRDVNIKQSGCANVIALAEQMGLKFYKVE